MEDPNPVGSKGDGQDVWELNLPEACHIPVNECVNSVKLSHLNERQLIVDFITRLFDARCFIYAKCVCSRKRKHSTLNANMPKNETTVPSVSPSAAYTAVW